jgi:hypothetical protein
VVLIDSGPRYAVDWFECLSATCCSNTLSSLARRCSRLGDALSFSSHARRMSPHAEHVPEMMRSRSGTRRCSVRTSLGTGKVCRPSRAESGFQLGSVPIEVLTKVKSIPCSPSLVPVIRNGEQRLRLRTQKSFELSTVVLRKPELSQHRHAV